MRKKNHWLFWASLSALTVASAPTALAQQSNPAPAGAAGTSTATDPDQVVVTARRQSELLQNVPVAVTAISAQALQDRGIQTPNQLELIVPSLRIVGAPGTPSSVRFLLRGQSSGGVILTVDQPVGVYLNDIYVARPNGINASLFDLSRVEVLRGPQGTLYGRNTTGGAVKFVTHAPDFNGLHGFGEAELGNFNDQKYSLAANVPIIDNVLAGRIAYQRWSRDGFGSSATTGERLGEGHDDNFARGSLLFKPSDTFRVDLFGEWLQMRQTGDLIVPVGLRGGPAVCPSPSFPSPAGTAGPLQHTLANFRACIEDPVNGAATLNSEVAKGNADIFHGFTERNTHDDVDAVTLGLNVGIDLRPDLHFQSITGYRHYRTDVVQDLDGTKFTILEVGWGQGGINFPNLNAPKRDDQTVSFASQEFDLSGRSFSGRMNWLFGAYASFEDGSDNSQSVTANNGTNYDAFRATQVTNNSWAIFGQSDFDITSRLSVTLGARYTEETRGLITAHNRYSSVTNTFTACRAGTYPATLPAPTFPSTDPNVCAFSQEQIGRDGRWDGVSWLVSANYKLTDNILVYLRSSRGFRSGAFQLRAPLQPAVDPEFATDVELGVKSELFDRRLTLNLAAYTTDYQNKQESQVLPGPTTVLTNAAAATIKGFEGEFNARLGGGLTLYGSLTYLDGQYDSYPNALNVNGDAFNPVNGSGVDFADPRWRYSLGGRYQRTIGPGQLGLQADWGWHDKQNLTPLSHDPAFGSASLPESLEQRLTGAVGLLNLRADYELPNSGWNVALFATNALDKHYQIMGLNQATTGIVTGITQAPRMFGIQLHKSFGAE